MKKYRLIWRSLIILGVISVIYVWSISNCMFYGMAGVTNSISRSKELNVFINEYNYKFYRDTALFMDSNAKLEIEEIYNEKIWKRGYFDKPFFDSNTYSFF